MPKVGRPKSLTPSVHTAIVISPSLHEQLKAEAACLDVSISAYVRTVLEQRRPEQLRNPPHRATESRLTLVCSLDVSVPEALEQAKELVEKARETGAIIEASVSLPSTEVDLA